MMCRQPINAVEQSYNRLTMKLYFAYQDVVSWDQLILFEVRECTDTHK